MTRQPIKPVILSCAGTALTDDEKKLIAAENPFGFILFSRSCKSPEQVQQLTAEFRALVERADAPVLIDQEGGRVARLREPTWREFPAAASYGTYTATHNDGPELTETSGRLMGAQCRALGITVNCAPMVDLPTLDAHAGVIGDRTFAKDAETITQLARAYAKGLMQAGVLPIMKHIPGHGRATADSHEELPVVKATRAELEASDFLPFKNLNLPLAMTAHVLYPALDAELPATLSPTIINDIIRGWIGFDGLLVADTLEMKALTGSLGSRCQRAISAGNDVVLYCPGDVAGNLEVLQAAPPMTEVALARWKRAQSYLPSNFAGFDQQDYEELQGKLSVEYNGATETVDSIVAHL